MKPWSKADADFFAARNREIYRAKVKGVTYQMLADKYGLGRERIRQIVETQKRRDRHRCNRCQPQHFWVGDLFFGSHSQVMQLDPYEREGHEPIEMMADVVYMRRNPKGHNGRGWRDYPTNVESWLAWLYRRRTDCL